MPAQHRLRFDDQESLLPGFKLTGKENEETTLSSHEVRAFDRAVEDDQLLTKQKVFSDQLWFTPSEVNDGPEHRSVSDWLDQVR